MANIRVVELHSQGENIVIVGEYYGVVSDTPSFTFPAKTDDDAIEAATKVVEVANVICDDFGIMAFPLGIMPFETIKAGHTQDFIDEQVELGGTVNFDKVLDIPGADKAQAYLDQAHAELC